jgi:hypothetical protein
MTRGIWLALLMAAATVVDAQVGVSVSPDATTYVPAPQVPPRDRAIRRTGTASIRGVVVDGATGAPIRRAAVSLLIEEPEDDGARVVGTTADASGQFAFTGVPAGRVQVTATRVGYFDYDNIWTGELQDPVWQPVADGQRIQGVRIALYRGGVIAGRVHDEFGEPAAGVEVEVLRVDPGDRGGGVRSALTTVSPTTDDTGAFRVWGLAPGDYLVGARPNRFVADPAADRESARQGYAATYFPGTPQLGDARPVRVTPGRDTTGIAFALVPVRLAAVRGTVLLPPDTAAREVNLSLSALIPRRLDGGLTRSARLQDDGSFEVGRLAPGTYQVTARRFRNQGGLTAYGTATVDVAGEDVDGVSVTMRAASVVGGRVVDERGAPLNVPVMVSLVSLADARTPAPPPARTYSDGSFRIEGAFGLQHVRAVEARLLDEVQSPNLITRSLFEVTPATRQRTTWWLKAVAVDGRDVTDEAIDFDQVRTLDITMTNRAAVVHGSVSWRRSASGRPPAVVVFVDDESRWTRPTRWVGTAEVDAQGRFEVRGLPPAGRYLAVAVDGAPRSVLSRPEMLLALRGLATPVRVDDGATVDVGLTAVPRPLR